MLRVEMLPAGHGDSIWIEYGESSSPRRVLIDGGTGPTYDTLRARIASLAEGDRRFDLAVVTHIDADHIEGFIRLLQDRRLGMEFADVWFNGWRHLPGAAFGPEQGEILSALLTDREIPWNQASGGGPICVSDDGALPTYELEGGLTLTVLGPTGHELEDLMPVWEREVRKEGLVPGSTREALDLLLKTKRLLVPTEFEPGAPALDVEALATPDDDSDSSEPNASSITLLAEFEGRSVLLAADCVAGVLAADVRRLLEGRRLDVLEVDAFKLPHHGSRRNVRDDFLPLVASRRYLVSTNGAYFDHPDPEAIARVLVRSEKDRTLLFNYRTQENEIWDDPLLMERWGYSVAYPQPGTLGMATEL
ncbi:MAG TPA: MBL fold metallo-hydrolase [Actinomycetota bacterium]|nr:MBL fold metallo-hydrolase [Actinomycetota bacterium]